MADSLEHDGEHPLYVLERGEITEAEFLARARPRARASCSAATSTLHGFGARLMDALEPNQELFDYYAALRRERGVRFALLHQQRARVGAARGGPKLPIDDLFELVVDSAFVGMRKPEPEIYALTLERLGLPAAACVFVDDLEPNVVAAREAGMRGIVYRDTAQAIAELDALW